MPLDFQCCRQSKLGTHLLYCIYEKPTVESPDYVSFPSYQLNVLLVSLVMALLFSKYHVLFHPVCYFPIYENIFFLANLSYYIVRVL